MDATACEAGLAEAYEVAFMRQVLRWFKHGFFKWTNSPSCEHCGSSDTHTVGSTSPTPTEKQFGAGNVEVAQCRKCGGQTRFPRYNDPSKLLETRNGRCGEWANCFTLLCRALGYEARHVHDWTDHVWTEVYSDSLQRWLHADSCEAALDTPLVYEQGWGKKLTYCIAYARDNVLDVTRRYTRKFDELLTRRKEFTEQQLKQALVAINEFALDRAVSMLPEDAAAARRGVLQRRAEQEERELAGGEAVKAGPKAEEQVGRTSGDAQWREQRGELGANPTAKAQALELSEKGLASVAPAGAPAVTSTQPAPPAPSADSVPSAELSRERAQAIVKAKVAEHVAAGLSPKDAVTAVLAGKSPVAVNTPLATVAADAAHADPAAGAKPSSSATSAPADAKPAAAAGKEHMQSMFKARYAEYIEAGLPPNEAALAALEDMKSSSAP